MKNLKLLRIQFLLIALMLLIYGCKKNSILTESQPPIESKDIFWQFANGPSEDYVLSFAVHSSGRTFVGTLYGGLYHFDSDNNSWVQLHLGGSWNDARTIAIDKNGILYVGTGGGNIYRSTDVGEHWTNVASNLTPDFITCILVNSSNYVFAGSNTGIFRSTDNGATWVKTNSGIVSGSVVYALVETSNGAIIAGTDGGSGLFRSTDNGNNWTQHSASINSIRTISLAVCNN
ncbi:MAG: hypothetical protein KGJ59_13855, partial [Bacteroidota bacterium]|nr:hypothetical protein [Bacteroidota bacterium]